MHKPLLAVLGLQMAALFGLTLTASAPQAMAQTVVRSTAAATTTDTPLDQIILNNGSLVNGRIVEESDDEVKIIVTVGTIAARSPTTYKRSEILEIKRGAVEAAPVAREARAPSTSTRTEKIDDPLKGRLPDRGDEQGSKLYITNLDGAFGVTISETPLRRLFDDADREFDDIDPATGKVRPELRDKNIIVLRMDCESDPRLGFDGLFRAEQIEPVISNQLRERNRRVVFWVKKAVNGAAFLPWISPEIYFHSEGQMGFTQNLDTFSSGDKMVDEKLVSARIGHAEGFLRMGGYDPVLIKPMCRMQYWLAVKFEGGQPIYLTHKPRPQDGDDWIILSDDGQGENKDKSLIRGNDMLSLDAEWAHKLGVSKRTVSTVEDLAFALGVHRNYTVLDKGKRDIFDKWRDEIESALKMINRDRSAGPIGKLWLDYQEIQVNAPTYRERTQQRGRKLQILRQIRAILTRYAEVWDSSGSGRAQIDVMIEELEQEQRRDRNVGSPGGGRPGGGGGGGGTPGIGKPGGAL